MDPDRIPTTVDTSALPDAADDYLSVTRSDGQGTRTNRPVNAARKRR
jgi:hypothetical protein